VHDAAQAADPDVAAEHGAAPPNPASHLNRVCQDLAELGGFQRVALFLGPDASGRTRLAASHGLRHAEGDLTMHALASGSVIGAPLRRDDRVVGFLLADRLDRHDGPSTREIVNAFARGASSILDVSAINLDVVERLHDTVVQRLSGLTYMLAAQPGQSSPLCHQLAMALDELRAAIDGRAAAPPAQPRYAGELEGLQLQTDARVRWIWPLEDIHWRTHPLVEAFLTESLRNVRKHAWPASVHLRCARGSDTVAIEVRNDGVATEGSPGPGLGLGLKLLVTRALDEGARVESGPEGNHWWSQRLTLPLST
jgi:hypothetical protein